MDFCPGAGGVDFGPGAGGMDFNPGKGSRPRALDGGMLERRAGADGRDGGRGGADAGETPTLLSLSWATVLGGHLTPRFPRKPESPLSLAG